MANQNGQTATDETPLPIFKRQLSTKTARAWKDQLLARE